MKRKILLTFLALFFSINLSYANYDELLTIDKEKTIKELKLNIEDLDKAKTGLDEKSINVVLDDTLFDFLKSELTLKENALLNDILKVYNEKREELEKQLVEKSKKLEDTKEINDKLFNLRKNLYESILDYVEPSKYSLYLKYINKQTNLYLEEIELDSDIIKKSEIVNEKLTNIEEKIKEHKEYMNETLKVLINEEIDLKITTIVDGDNFKNMPNDKKLTIVNKVIEKVDTMQKGFIYENNVLHVADNIKANNNKKIEICMIMLDKFIKLKKEIEKDIEKGTVINK